MTLFIIQANIFSCKSKLQMFKLSRIVCIFYYFYYYYLIINLSSFWQSIWISSRGGQKELDEAKMKFAAAEVLISFNDFNCDWSLNFLYWLCLEKEMRLLIWDVSKRKVGLLIWYGGSIIFSQCLWFLCTKLGIICAGWSCDLPKYIQRVSSVK